jgi:hypothetical protein
VWKHPKRVFSRSFRRSALRMTYCQTQQEEESKSGLWRAHRSSPATQTSFIHGKGDDKLQRPSWCVNKLVSLTVHIRVINSSPRGVSLHRKMCLTRTSRTRDVDVDVAFIHALELVNYQHINSLRLGSCDTKLFHSTGPEKSISKPGEANYFYASSPQWNRT